MTSDRRAHSRRRLALPAAALLAGALLTTAGVATAGSTGASAAARPATTPAITHVFQIMLENEAETSSFPGTNTELDQLAAQGVFVPKYYGTGHASADNYIALISGQAQFSSTSADCFNYHNTGGTVDAKGFYQPVKPSDTGCVFPASVKTLADQLRLAKKGWRGYMEDMGNTPGRETKPCGQPESGGVAINPAVGGTDSAIAATAADQYATRHNPFVYFHSLIDPLPATGKSNCVSNVFPFSRFATDVAKSTYAPAYTFITPNLCDDGHDGPCKGPGADANPGAGHLTSANAFLAKVVPMIQASAAYQNHGLILVTFDEGVGTAGCCGESKFSTGGGQVGAVLLGPDLTAHVSNCSYNHFSLLKTWEDLFHLTPTATGIYGSDGKGHLAHAGDFGVGSLIKELSATTSPCP